MKKRTSSLIVTGAALGLASFGIASSASAAPTQIASNIKLNLTGGSCANNGATCSFTRQFSAFDNSSRTVNVTATAWSVANNQNGWNGLQHERAQINNYSNGLGVTSNGDPDRGSPQHALDNIGDNEYIVLQFDQQVRISSLTSALYNTSYGTADGDTNVMIGDAQTGFWNFMDPLAALGNIDTGLTRRDGYAGGSSGNGRSTGSFAINDTDAFNFGANVFGNTVVLSADLFGHGSYHDAMKLKYLYFDVFEMGPGNQVPAPGALALLGLGVAGLAAARRRAAR
ncbi:PEP-CTERM sorting domain-containing protein [Pacificimonas sp. WHA3]|uniref:PEP-CTERM sorting domain-containing protein n=1 Tax=Pacificimonas pallii TaxID=2827236 RepID=A0ABS6SBE3_9SPHN|nr:PEP-CTERM sorting domain-containing protein [Pacificimonas pallii]MBV7255251.1 PEP-CTERM sorting domain-containing protein [Pacificimonas pallii]